MLSYREHAPAPELRTLIECLWRAHDPRARPARPRDHIIPDACPEIIVHLGDSFRRLVGGRWRRQSAAFLAGTLSRPWHLRAGARVHTLGIRFRPGALTRLFDFDMAAATDREVPLEDLVGADWANELVTRLQSNPRADRAMAATNQWLIARLREAKPRREDVASRAVRAVLGARGRVRVSELAGDLGVSSRRLERSFARHLGIRPTLFARIVRLQAALATLESAERGRAVEWALEAGYFDQAHLARDFRALAGRRALHSRDRDGELARHFCDPARLLAMLAEV